MQNDDRKKTELILKRWAPQGTDRGQTGGTPFHLPKHLCS